MNVERQLLNIAAPAFVQFAVEPLARLVDTAYLGRLNPAASGGAAAAIAAQYAVAKLYTDPLLRTSVSLVAGARELDQGDAALATAANATAANAAALIDRQQQLSGAIASALYLALAVGLLQALAFGSLAGPILRACNVCPSSPMRTSALGYLRICAVGAPAATLWLVCNGIFRGLGDTATPLVYSLLFTALNAILDPLLIFRFNMGAAGAAAGTAIAQVCALLPLMCALERALSPPGTARRGAIGSLRALFGRAGGLASLRTSLAAYARAGSIVLFRTIGKISAYSVVAREAARLGAVAISAHNLCFQLGVATSQVCEGLAVATQTLLAQSMGGEPSARARAVGKRVLRFSFMSGVAAAGTLSALTYATGKSVIAGMSTDMSVRAAALEVLPLVLLCQVLKGLAYPVNGALMGGCDWEGAAVIMWIAQATCLASVTWLSRSAGGLTLPKLWATLAIMFIVLVGGGLGRIASGTGPWAALKGGAGELDETSEWAAGKSSS